MVLTLVLIRYILILVASERVYCDICELSDDLNGCYKKFLSYEAIGHIHKYLDNDKNGEVDSSEAAKFVREEFSATEPSRKSQLLTSEDPLVSLPDLWLMWKRNPAFNWTVQQMVQWLSDSVDLPQYSDIFVRHSVDGKSLPLLALQNMSFLTNVLLIQNPIDKRKIMLKSLDTILFGPPRKSPILFSTKASFITASCGVGFVLALLFLHGPFHHRLSCPLSDPSHGDSSNTERGLKQLQQRLDDLEQLRRVVNNWETNAAYNPKSSTVGSTKQVTELDYSTSIDRPAKPIFTNPEDKSEDGDSSGSQLDGIFSHDLDLPYSRSVGPCLHGVPNELTLWLQLTYEMETQHHREKKAEAEAQLNAARHACKRLNRKRYNILGSVRLLHTDSLDELEDRLMHSKRVLEQLQGELQERSRRWSRIEYLTGVQIQSNPGLPQLMALLGRGNQHTPELGKCGSVVYPFGTASANMTCYKSTTDLYQTHGEENVLIDQAFAGSRSQQDNVRSGGQSLEAKPAGLPRSYSFVRPFANLWRRKAKSSKAAGR